MPIYTYKCKDCGEIFDFLMITKTEKPKCEKCGSEKLEKQITVFGVRGNSSSTGGPNCAATNT